MWKLLLTLSVVSVGGMKQLELPYLNSEFVISGGNQLQRVDSSAQHQQQGQQQQQQVQARSFRPQQYQPQHQQPHPQHLQKRVLPMQHQHHPQNQFSSRSGVLDQIKSFFAPSTQAKDKMSLPPRMRDMHRVPKPPKYPLYDLDSISMATPPPAPLMHPMSSLPTDQFSVYQLPEGEQYGHGQYERERRPVSRDRDHHQNQRQKNHNRQPQSQHHQHDRRRPQPHPIRRNGPQSRRPTHGAEPRPPVQHQRPRTKRPPPPAIKDKAPTEYFPHPMATNLEPIKVSPALGRPLGFEEYMQRPSNSYVNDPWNFDPFANQMNAGLQTSGLKYNYDPLGMNTLDNSPATSHLDPTKLSYPGDSFLKNDNNAANNNYMDYSSNFNNNANYNTGNYNTNNNFEQQRQPDYPQSYYTNTNNQQQSESTQHASIVSPSGQQQIQFTIETSPTGIQIEPVINQASSLTDAYSSNTGPYGPNGYQDPLTPEDILPPPPPIQNREFYEQSNYDSNFRNQQQYQSELNYQQNNNQNNYFRVRRSRYYG